MSEERLSEVVELWYDEDRHPETKYRSCPHSFDDEELLLAVARRALEPIPESVFDGVGAWERHKLLEAYRQYLLNGESDE